MAEISTGVCPRRRYCIAGRLELRVSGVIILLTPRMMIPKQSATATSISALLNAEAATLVMTSTGHSLLVFIRVPERSERGRNGYCRRTLLGRKSASILREG